MSPGGCLWLYHGEDISHTAFSAIVTYSTCFRRLSAYKKKQILFLQGYDFLFNILVAQCRSLAVKARFKD